MMTGIEPAEAEGVPADFVQESEAEKEQVVEEMTAPTDEKAAVENN